MSDELEQLRRLHEVATERTVQLAAVIEQVREWHRDPHTRGLAELGRILSAADTEAR